MKGEYEMSHAEKARELFVDKKLNCAQSVAAAFADDFGYSQEDIVRLSAAFGGGIARMREVCGAVLGIAMVMGMAEGGFDPGDSNEKQSLYKHTQILSDRFRDRNGSIICGELLGVKRNGNRPSERNKEFLKRPCAEYVEFAASLLEEYLNQSPLD